MTFRSGVYIVPTNQWYIERTVWLIAGVVLLTSTALAEFVNPLFVLFVIAAYQLFVGMRVWLSSGVGTTSGCLQVGHLVERPANSSLTWNFIPHWTQEN